MAPKALANSQSVQGPLAGAQRGPRGAQVTKCYFPNALTDKHDS